MSGRDPSAQAQWVARVLGVVPARTAEAPDAARVAALGSQAATAVSRPIPRGEGLAPLATGRPIAPALPGGPAVVVQAAGGRTLSVATAPDGRVALTAPPPPVGEITFAGGGGKGAALPGAVAALEQSGVLAEVKVVNGASVGSMTAAMVAAGMTADDFRAIANDPRVAGRIKEGHSLPGILFGGGLTGEGLESLVREQLSKAVGKQIAAYEEAGGADPGVLGVKSKLEGGRGVTFGDLRTLSRAIPAVKELAISGTYMGDDSASPGTIARGKPQLAMFSADTEPDLDVARAVHASAALPPVFHPVDIPLSSGMTARFEDGGVMNNAPSSELVGAARQLDPMPERGRLTFVFQGDANEEVVTGTVTPRAQTISDFLAKAPFAVAEYAQQRGLADRPEDVVMVPLRFTAPATGKKRDFSTLLGGLLNFDMPLDDKLLLQSKAEEATSARVAQHRQPQTRTFASARQMLDCISRPDLAGLAAADYPGAADELAFRDAVTAAIAQLEALASGTGPAALDTGPVADLLAHLDTLSGGDVDREGFVAREMSRSGRLDPLLDAAGRAGRGEPAVLAAAVAVAEALDVQAHARTILREAVYPKMMTEKPDGAGGVILQQIDAILRAAVTPDDINEALTIGITHFGSKSDTFGRHGHRAFAQTLRAYLMPDRGPGSSGFRRT